MKKQLIGIFLVFTMIFTSGIAAFATDDLESRNAALYWLFTKTSETEDQTSAAAQKVSADMTGPGNITATLSKTVSRSLSVSISSDQENLVKSSISASYGTSLTNTLGYSLGVASGMKGYMAFRPYLIVVKGDLKQYNSLYPGVVLATTNVTAKYPKKLSSGFADGHFYIHYV